MSLPGQLIYLDRIDRKPMTRSVGVVVFGVLQVRIWIISEEEEQEFLITLTRDDSGTLCVFRTTKSCQSNRFEGAIAMLVPEHIILLNRSKNSAVLKIDCLIRNLAITVKVRGASYFSSVACSAALRDVCPNALVVSRTTGGLSRFTRLLSGSKGGGDGKSDGSSSRTHVGVIDGGDDDVLC